LFSSLQADTAANKKTPKAALPYAKKCVTSAPLEPSGSPLDTEN
jgi:hypothetical protein